MSILHAIILAAGEGTRMKSQRPKVLHPICGRPMLFYSLDLAGATGVKQPILILGKGADEIKPVLPKEAQVVIQTKREGTGDAVLAARKLLKGMSGDLLVLYADTPLLRRTTIQKLVESHKKHGAGCTLLTAHLADPSGYGRIVRDEQNVIRGVVEEAEATSQQRAIREINVGPFVCKVPLLLEALANIKPASATKELYLTQALTLLAQMEGVKITTERVPEIYEALGINSRAELARANEIIRQRIITTHLSHGGVTIVDPRTTFIDHGVSIGHDTVIHPCTVIETGVSIGRRCTIGPFARLRSGVAISDDSRVGNFVEMVRTKVGHRVRVSHVSYLGDTTVEDDVNIGAGTITANYDGRDKHPTHIGKGALIGSDTILVAPVKVGPGAVTGAGSVILHHQDVAARSRVAGVPARVLDGRNASAGDGGRSEGGRKAPAPHASVKPATPATAARPTPKAAAKPNAKAAAKGTRRAKAKPARRPAVAGRSARR
ncbi:MAG TPA: NTP transferase domain-containing protein [bacterium]